MTRTKPSRMRQPSTILRELSRWFRAYYDGREPRAAAGLIAELRRSLAPRTRRVDQLAGHVAFFGCDDKQGLGDAVITWEDDGHSGAGWYIHCDEYPEEGSAFLDGNHNPFPELLKLLQEQAVRDRHMVPAPTPDVTKGGP